MRELSDHITGKDVKAWISGMLSEEEEQIFLLHTGSCDDCAELLAVFLEQDLLEPPAYLAEEIREKSRSMGIRTVRTVRQTSRQMRMFLYSLKVGFALAVSLLMLFCFPKADEIVIRQKADFLEDAPSITERLRDSSEKVNLLLDQLTGWPTFMKYEEEQND